ncbi:GNAT family N-acetyltransferase [Streptomyces sp. NPDC089424]|uniref:GNAT family N-acetyltransferase n=1 Tax=Streptomyces sp. NPDC089424 TaxID=3365917 RepID=UPI0038206546
MVVDFLKDLTPQLANCRDYWLGWGVGGSLDDDLSCYRSGLADPQLNGVLRRRGTQRAERAIREAAERLAGVPWMWWVGPDSAPDTAECLVRHGAVPSGAMPVMAVDIDRLAEPDGPAGLSVRTVDDADALGEWVRVYGPSFGFPPGLHDGILRVESERPDAARIVRLVGRIEGRAVGTALLYEAHGVAGVYVVTTLEADRRQGVGAVLTAAALRTARARGVRIGTLQASGPGASLYRRMGFTEVAAYRLFRLPAG